MKRIFEAEEEEKKKKWARAGGLTGWAGADAGRMSGASAGGGSSARRLRRGGGRRGRRPTGLAAGLCGWGGGGRRRRRPEKEAQRARASVFRSGGDYFGLESARSVLSSGSGTWRRSERLGSGGEAGALRAGRRLAGAGSQCRAANM